MEMATVLAKPATEALAAGLRAHKLREDDDQDDDQHNQNAQARQLYLLPHSTRALFGVCVRFPPALSQCRQEAGVHVKPMVDVRSQAQEVCS